MSTPQPVSTDITVIGAGLIGLVVAAALAQRGQQLIVLDAGSATPRADRGNFGLVWVQGKGADQPAYAELTRLSADNWPAFAEQLLEHSGIDVALRQGGGIELCLSESDYAAVAASRARLGEQAGTRFEYQMLERQSLAERLPGIGAGVFGGCYCPHDGHVNPLRLLHALRQIVADRGATIAANQAVQHLERNSDGFVVHTRSLRVESARVVCAAGLGNVELSGQLGVALRLRPQRGQILVTERLAPLLDLPTSLVRQTNDGTCLLGDSHEDVGLDTGTSAAVMGDIAAAAVTAFPALRDVRVVRAWGALRCLSEDGLPVYVESERYPGAFVFNAHSAVTLAAAHDQLLADWVLGGARPAALAAFDPRRFDVSH